MMTSCFIVIIGLFGWATASLGPVFPHNQGSRTHAHIGCLFVQAKEDTTIRQTSSLAEIDRDNAGKGCVYPLRPELQDCKTNNCYHQKYRAIDGSCNNMNHPTQGAAFTPFLRLWPSEYEDNVDQIARGSIRPSARELSRILLQKGLYKGKETYNAYHYSSLLLAWGQLVSHDMTHSTTLPNTCYSCDQTPRCAPIPTTPADTWFGRYGCIKMARSTPVCYSNPRQQLNENTAFLDGSLFYGSSKLDHLQLRLGYTGFLRTTVQYGKTFPPIYQGNILAGDDRANSFLGLAALHTLFIREHNRLAGQLKYINPHWNGDRLFQETRKIIGAEIQHITYYGFLPKFLGGYFEKHVGKYYGYNLNLDTSISNTFTASAYRIGHALIQDWYWLADNYYKNVDRLHWSKITHNTPYLFKSGVDHLIRGLMTSPAKMVGYVASWISDEWKVDLPAIDIQRGRDHGIRNYNDWRDYCGLKRAYNMEDLRHEIPDYKVRKQLHAFYGHPDNIDLYVGGLLEVPPPNAMVGPTLACIIGDQFKRTRDGDRLWYQKKDVFTRAQLVEIQHASISRILCDNGDYVTHAPIDAFFVTGYGNKYNRGPVSCARIPGINLEAWRETPVY